jgi:hypothetical protein
MVKKKIDIDTKKELGKVKKLVLTLENLFLEEM